jgi:hypothetical protein
MAVEKVIEKYLQLIKTEHFTEYKNDLAYRIQIGLNEGYGQGFDEPAMVSLVEKIINKLDGLSVSTNKVKISSKSIFIHGNKSQVEFEYYGQTIQRELGDLIFILSVIYNGSKYFEKFTISQFKKDNDKLRWDLSNKEQIYLLSRFPSFRGIKGSIIPMKEFNLPNYSGCLGSFNLLFRPGDFVFVSAPRLESFLGNRKSLSRATISKLEEQPCYYFPYPEPFDWPHIEDLFYFWRKLWRHGMPIAFYPPYFIGILGFSRFASNIHEFVDNYLRGNIGELTYSDIGIYNTPAFDFLCELLSAIKKKAQKEGKTEFIKFIDEFFGHPYAYGGQKGGIREGVEFDYEGGGIGIIYTSINLGGEKGTGQ